MSIENMPSLESGIDLSKYDRVTEKNGEYYLDDNIRLSVKEGGLYIAEGQHDEGARILSKDDETIPSGF